MAEPSLKTIKRLFAMSGNVCAFPGCQVAIVEDSGTVTGEICHIKAKNSKGTRYDKKQTEHERNAFENLILLCRNHHKIVDDNSQIYDVSALLEIKSIHESLMKRNEVDQDSIFARILLNDLKQISISNNSGNVMIGSPGSIQAGTLNINNTKSKVTVAAPQGSIGDNVNYAGYIQHLIKRYNKFASTEPTRKRKFSYGALSDNIEKTYGAEWRLLPIEKADEVIAYIQARIERTRQAKINKGKGWKSFSTYAEYLEKYGK